MAQAEYSDLDAVKGALEGTETALMVSGSETADRVQQHRTFVDAAVEAGVQHLVYTSFFGAAADATFTLARDHWATEEHIKASGLRWTCLRDNLYLDFFPLLAGEDGVIRGPGGEGRVSAVAQDDIAVAAATILRSPADHVAATYRLTGPEALSFAEAAAVLTQHVGREFSYHAESMGEAYESRAGYGAPPWQVDAWVSTYTAVAAGEMETVTDDVLRLIGRAPMSLADLLS